MIYSDTPQCRAISEFYSLPGMTVSFSARQLSRARVIWLNSRWFAELGVDVSCAETRRELEEILLRDFAFMVPSRYVIEGRTLGGRTLTATADRYGDPFGAHHGGSGRCAIRNGYLAKGIGVTPLVPPEGTIDKGHVNGFLWLRDAVREAIYSEIARVELPYGAIPTIAIIDAGFYANDENHDGAIERCAISIRPAFIRPAHFARSIFFGTAGKENSDQFIDAVRVRSAVQYVSGVTKDNILEFRGLDAAYLRWGEQLGAMYGRLLWPGRFLLSNISLDGAIADFGSVQAVPNWDRLHSEVEELFGSEVEYLLNTIFPMRRYFEKYSEWKFADVTILKNRLVKTVGGAMAKTLSHGMNVENDPDFDEEVFSGIVAEIFRKQQQVVWYKRRDMREEVELASIVEKALIEIAEAVDINENLRRINLARLILRGQKGKYLRNLRQKFGFRLALTSHKSTVYISEAIRSLSKNDNIDDVGLSEFISAFISNNVCQ